MKRLLLIVVAACSHATPSPGNAPPTPAPAPGCYTPVATTGSATANTPAMVGSDMPIDCSQDDHDEAAIYCARVHDPCCVPGGWTCNNDRYHAWYAQQCAHPVQP